MKKSLLIHPDELSPKWVQRAADLGLDTLALHPRGGKAASRSLAELLDLLEQPSYRALIDSVLDRGIAIEYEFHAAGWLLPRSLFETHPEWFRTGPEGERVPDLNFCMTNPEALGIVVKRAKELASRLYRNSHTYYFWLDDAKDCFCHCDACRRFSPSDLQMTVQNAILAGIREDVPDARLSYLAYFETMPTPKSVKPADGIFLEYAPMERDMHKPLREQTCKDAEALRGLLSFFGQKNAKVLEYWYDNSMFSNWTKPPKPFEAEHEIVRDDVAYYRDLGFETVSSFACYLGPDYETLYGEPDLGSFGF